MKLGTQTSSLVNHLQSRGVIGEPAPVVGMGATILRWSDRDAATIVSVDANPKSKAYSCIIEVVADDYKVVSGSTHDGSAKFEFTPAKDGRKYIYRKNAKTGMWESAYKSIVNNRLLKGEGGLRIGERDKYVDPSF